MEAPGDMGGQVMEVVEVSTEAGADPGLAGVEVEVVLTWVGAAGGEMQMAWLEGLEILVVVVVVVGPGTEIIEVKLRLKAETEADARKIAKKPSPAA